MNNTVMMSRAPILEPQALFTPPHELLTRLKQYPRIQLHSETLEENVHRRNIAISAIPPVSVNYQAPQPLAPLTKLYRTISRATLILRGISRST